MTRFTDIQLSMILSEWAVGGLDCLRHNVCANQIEIDICDVPDALLCFTATTPSAVLRRLDRR